LITRAIYALISRQFRDRLSGWGSAGNLLYVNDKTNPQARFTELYQREYPAVYRFAARRGAVDPAAVAHETFLAAWQRLDAIPLDQDAARAWLYTAARNHLLHDQRTAVRADKLAVKVAADFDEALAGPESGRIASVDLAAAWAKLPPEHQELLALLGWEELSIGQAAKVLGISAPTARLRLKKARAALRDLLAERESQTVSPTSGSQAIPRAVPQGGVRGRAPTAPEPTSRTKSSRPFAFTCKQDFIPQGAAL